MARPIDPRVRQRVLDRVTTHIVANGFGNQSLDELARRSGVSKRMLVYHFGTRDDLIQELVVRIETEWMELLIQRLRGLRHPYNAIEATWRELCRPRNLRRLRLIFEIWGTSLQEPPRRARVSKLLSAWTSHVAGILEGKGDPRREAVLLLAVVNGLLLARLTGESQEACDAALERALGMLRDEERTATTFPPNNGSNR